MATKYEVYTDRFEFRFGTYKDSIPDLDENDICDLYWSRDNDAKLFGSFDTKEEALEELSKFDPDTYPQKGNCFWLLLGSVAWANEAEYTDDGEFDMAWPIGEFRCAPYIKGKED